MKTHVTGCCLALILLLQVSSASAQEVYMTRDGKGKAVFSDRPLADAEAVALRPLNTMLATPVAQSTQVQSASMQVLSADSARATSARRSCGR